MFLDRKALREKRARARELRQDSTMEERALWYHLRAHRMAGLHFRRQHVLHGFIADFYCHAAKLIIEVDGMYHFDQVEADQERDAILTDGGIAILRISNRRIRKDLSAVLHEIEDTARARAGLPGRRVKDRIGKGQPSS